MATAFKFNEHNVVTACVEIPDEYEESPYGYLNYVLKLPGNWLSAKKYEQLTGQIVTTGAIFFPQKNRFIYNPSPHDGWVLDDNLVWTPPIKNELRNMNFGYDNELSEGPTFFWNEERKKWGHCNIENHILNDNKRKNGIYHISKCIKNTNFDNASDYVKGMDVKCLPKSYSYVEVHPDWNEEFVYPIFRETFAKKYGVTQDNPDKFLCYENYIVPFDGAPYFFIDYANLCNLNIKKAYNGNHAYVLDHKYEISNEFETEFIQEHPHIAGRTLGELFRLIIDWDLAYHYFGNRENTAILCHNILSTINMPTNIYNDIYNNTRPSMIEKFINNSKDALDIGERQETPDSVLSWFAEKYWDLRYLKHHDNLNIKDINHNHHLVK